jgi:Na+/H+ antiporter NhaD/arsenite permease-like protein
VLAEVAATVLVIWGSGIASGIVDNITFTATMIPVIQDVAEGLSEEQTRSLWWTLALGADFGGNLTLIGASANVVVAGMSERAGQKYRSWSSCSTASPLPWYRWQ